MTPDHLEREARPIRDPVEVDLSDAALLPFEDDDVQGDRAAVPARPIFGDGKVGAPKRGPLDAPWDEEAAGNDLERFGPDPVRRRGGRLGVTAPERTSAQRQEEHETIPHLLEISIDCAPWIGGTRSP